MPITPVSAYGRLKIRYSTYGKPHSFHVYVPEFQNDAATGTFVAGGSPATLDDLALEIADIMQGIINAGAAFDASQWEGQVFQVGSENSFITTVSGAVGAVTATPNASANPVGAPSSATYTYRTNDNHIAKLEVFGAVYVASNRLFLGDLSNGPLSFANYFLANIRVVGRDNTAFNTLVSNTYDSNDALQGKYRR